ncbi:DUF4350 domain-containing protein [Halobellus ordinarius]|uniref:DUF4350 domain-containing protein n=1 Tax=Halobellus ordinarius TaxID=3075120 RepID=UPI0028800294|nr:DUF4350 domain-containing protein [Halobellus sp. ZY16]
MRLGPRKIGYPHLLAVGLLLALLLGVGVGASTSAQPYGTFNPEWDGASGVRAVATDTGTETTVAYSTTEYADVDPGDSIAIVVSPETAYTDAEAARVASFVREGGTLVVAEDFRPHSNALLDRIGASARVNATPLRDERHNYRAGALPVATRTTTDPYTEGVDQLTLNYPGTVRPNGSAALVRSSNFSYRDRNGNGELDGNETLRSYPVVTAEPVGAGTVVVLSDPSVFINSMLDRPDNRAFATALLGPHETVLLDYSHVEERPPLQVALFALRDSPVLQFLVGTTVLGALAVVSRRADLDRE